MNDNERAASMARHPAGKQRPVVHTQGEEVDTNVGIKDATVTVLKAVDGTRKRRTRKKAAPRKATVRSLSEPPKNIKVDPRVMQAARRVIKQGVYTRLTIVDNETVVVR